MAYRNPKTDLTRGASQKKLASQAYRAMAYSGRRTKKYRQSRYSGTLSANHCTRREPNKDIGWR